MKQISRFVVAALAVAMCLTATVSAVAQTPTTPGAVPTPTPAPTPVPGGGIILPPHPEHEKAKADIENLKKDLDKAKADAKTAWDAAQAAVRNTSTTIVERRRLNQAFNDANAKVTELETALKAAESATAAAKADAERAKSVFAHCEELEGNAKADCLEQAGESKAEVAKIVANKLPDLNLPLGGLTHDGKVAMGGSALNGGKVRYRLRSGDTSFKFEAHVDPPAVQGMPITVTSITAAAQLMPEPQFSWGSWKEYVGVCAVGAVGFGGMEGRDYYKSRTPRQVDGDQALRIMVTGAATGCAGAMAVDLVVHAAVYVFSQ